MWKTLAHVCQRWRHIVFASPRRLDVQITCPGRTPTASLDVWPPFPIAVCYQNWERHVVQDVKQPENVNNVMAALSHADRISKLSIGTVPGSLSETFVAAMGEPFPALTALQLYVLHPQYLLEARELVLPETFLGGSAPLLRKVLLDGFAFPTLPKLLSSARHIVTLSITGIPHSGYIAPDAMASCLAALPNLNLFCFSFQSPRSRPDRYIPPPVTRTVLPALTYFDFAGVNEYLEDLVAQINAPLLNRLFITFFNGPVFKVPQLKRFISCSERLRAFDRAQMLLSRSTFVRITLGSQSQFSLGIKPVALDGRDQVVAMAQLCNGLLSLLSRVEVLEIFGGCQVDTLPTHSLELFHPFIAVQSLRVYGTIVSFLATALQELAGEGTTEVLPALRSIFLEGQERYRSVPQGIELFVTARRLSNCPIAVQC